MVKYSHSHSLCVSLFYHTHTHTGLLSSSSQLKAPLIEHQTNNMGDNIHTYMNSCTHIGTETLSVGIQVSPGNEWQEV